MTPYNFTMTSLLTRRQLAFFKTLDMENVRLGKPLAFMSIRTKLMTVLGWNQLQDCTKNLNATKQTFAFWSCTDALADNETATIIVDSLKKLDGFSQLLLHKMLLDPVHELDSKHSVQNFTNIRT